MASSVSVTELQRNAKSIIEDCVLTGKSKSVTRYSESPVTLVPTDRYLELLRTELAMRERDMLVRESLMRGWQDYQAGRLTPLEDVLPAEDAYREILNA